MTNDEDNLYLAMLAKVGLPDKKAKIQYNGTEHALFFRDNDNTILLDFIPEKLHSAMKQAKSVKIIETLSDFQTIIRQYEVTVQQSPSPYSKNIIDTVQTLEKTDF